MSASVMTMAKLGAQPTSDKTGVGAIDGNTKGRSGAIGSTTDQTGVGNLPSAGSISGVRNDGNKGRGGEAQPMPSPTLTGA